MENLKQSFGGFVDMGIIDSDGIQRTYVGPYPLVGKNYGDQEWFQQVVVQGRYISDVFLGYRRVPHLVIAVKHQLADGSFHILRATLDTDASEIDLRVEVSGSGDALLINHRGAFRPLLGSTVRSSRMSLCRSPRFLLKTEVLAIAFQGGAVGGRLCLHCRFPVYFVDGQEQKN